MKIDFTKGIHTNSHPVNTPSGYYRHAQNMRLSGMSRRSEEGTEVTNVDSSLIQWGDCPIGDETIIIGQKGANGSSIIGSLDIAGNWKVIVDRGFPDILGIIEPTQIEGRKDWKGDRLIYFATPEGARRINLDTYNSAISDSDFDKVTSLFLEYDLPRTSYIGENTNGEVLSGVYQAAARLVTDSGAGTIFGISSNVIPVVSDSLQSSRDSINGAPPQTPTTKAIVFVIDNIDPTFKYIEVGIITYVGTANTLKVTMMNRVLINGKTSIEITYRGTPDDKQLLTVDELITSGISYQTGKYLAQKDATLLIAAPEEAEIPDIDWWRVAQNMTSRYIIKEIPYAESLQFEIDTDVEIPDADNVIETSAEQLGQGYRNPITCALYKGYRRGEVYSFTLTPVFVSGVQGPTIHIPADHSSDTEAGVDPETTLPPNTANVVNLTPGSFDEWSVSAIDINGNASERSIPVEVQLTGGPTMPGNFRVSDIATNYIVFEWDASIVEYPTLLTAYWLYTRSRGVTSKLRIVEGAPPLTTIRVDGSWPINATYYIVGVDSDGTLSPQSDTISAVQPGGVAAPAEVTVPGVLAIISPPTNLVSSNIETTRFTLSWTASTSPDIREYKIFRDRFYHTSVYSPGGGNSNGNLGTFISEETYPDDRYPDISVGTGLRLHKFPTAVQEPLISGSVDLNTQRIRILGVEFSNIGLTDVELEYADQIAGFIIGRVDRRGNETQLAQGILRPVCDVKYNNDTTYTKSILLGDGTVSWQNIVLDKQSQNFDSGAADFSSQHFISPDLIHRAHTSVQGSYIKQHSLYKCNPFSINNEYSFKNMGAREEPSRANVFFKNIIEPSTETLNTSKKELDGSKVDVPPFGIPRMNGARGGKINTTVVHGVDSLQMCSSDGFTWIKSLDGSDIPNHLNDNGQATTHFHNMRARRSGTNIEDWNFLSSAGTRPNFVLYEMGRENPKQYGPLDQMVSMYTHYQEWKGFAGKTEFFNGDIFLSKYGLTINDEGFYPFTNNDDQDSPDQFVGFFKPPNTSCVVYMWVESVNNYGYRHFIQPATYTETAISATNGSMPYYPEYKQLVNNKVPFGILSMGAENWMRTGYASQYNQQYSAQPNVKPYPVTPKEDTELLASLVNRIIYSVEVVQGEKSDSYQIFLPNNFYDVPQEFGDLTDIYVNRELFASTNQIQWRLFFNTLATQVTSVGEVVLGTGGAFNRPAVPVQTVDGGFGGTSHWLHAENTIFGRVFVDRMQGRIFVLTDSLKDISRTLDEDERLFIQKIPLEDILIGSEPLRERAFIKLGTKGLLSYDLAVGEFISYHTLSPRWMFSHSSYMYSNHLASVGNFIPGIHKHSVGPTGVFYGELQDSSITLVANIAPEESKLFQKIELVTNMYTEKGRILPFNTFDKIQVWNDERNSGMNNLIFKDNAFKKVGVQELLVSKVKDSFRFVVPRDVIIDPSISHGSTSNQRQVLGGPGAAWLAKMRGNFVEIRLIYNNALGPIYLLNADIIVAKNER